VILYRFNSQPIEGIINPLDGLQDERLEMITTEGMLQKAPYTEVKALCVAVAGTKPTLFTENSFFERRPKLAGLWIRFFLRDGDMLEGLLSHNLLDWPDHGYWITPPRAGPGRQRVFLPRSSLSGTEMLGVIGTHRTMKARLRQESAKSHGQQLPMFDE